MSLRAYHDPALTRSITRDGSWARALEFPVGGDSRRTKGIYVLNNGKDPIPVRLEGNAAGFSLIMPPAVTCKPGVTRIPISVETGRWLEPRAADFTISGIAANEYGQQPYSNDAWSEFSSTHESEAATGEVLRVEASAFALATADERFGDFGDSPLRSVGNYTEYLAGGMGFVDADYKNTIVNLMAEHLYDPAVWALNKHLLFNALYGPLRFARERASTIGYNPPGIPALPPTLRRRVYSRAFELGRKTGSAEGIKGIFNAIGIGLTEMLVWRESFTWFVRVPQWVAAVYDIDFLGTIALYHVDPWCVINIATHEGTLDREYSDLDYTIEPAEAIQGGNLLLEDGQYYLLLEDGTKIILEGFYSSVEPVTYNGEQVTYGNEEITY